MLSFCKARTFGRTVCPFTRGVFAKTSRVVSQIENAVFVRTCSGGILKRIEKKQEEALIGGGQKRIDNQHRKVRNFLILYSYYGIRIYFN